MRQVVAYVVRVEICTPHRTRPWLASTIAWASIARQHALPLTQHSCWKCLFRHRTIFEHCRYHRTTDTISSSCAERLRICVAVTYIAPAPAGVEPPGLQNRTALHRNEHRAHGHHTIKRWLTPANTHVVTSFGCLLQPYRPWPTLCQRRNKQRRPLNLPAREWGALPKSHFRATKTHALNLLNRFEFAPLYFRYYRLWVMPPCSPLT